jgi:hypothetical protein
MATTKQVQKLLDEIRSTRAPVIVDFAIPIRPFFQITATGVELAKRDAKELAKTNYDGAKIDRIESLVELLRVTSAQYNDIKFEQPAQSRKFKQLRQKAESLRGDILAAMDLAFASDQNLLTKSAKIREGDSAPDLIQDLSDIAVIAGKNAELLKAINFDLTVIDTIPDLCTQLSQLLAQSTLDKSARPVEKSDLDRIYDQLEKMLVELNRVGRYTFRDDQGHATTYSLSYRPKKRKGKKAAGKNKEKSIINKCKGYFNTMQV